MLNKSRARIAVLSALVGLGAALPAYADDPIKIGLMLPNKGVFASISESFTTGWDLAYDEYNGEISGRKIIVLREDTEAIPTVALQKSRRLVQSEKVNILAGVVSSGVGVALGRAASRNKVPLVLGLAIADIITGKYCNPYVARTSFSANAFTSGYGAYLATKFKTASTLGPDYAAGRAMIGGFSAGFKKAGGKIVSQHWSAFKKTKDWGPLLAKINAENADITYSFYGGAEAIQVVKQYKAFGLDKKIPLYGDHWLYDEKLWGAMGRESVIGGRYVTSNAVVVDNPESKKFVKAFVAKYNKKPDVNAFLGYENAVAIFKTIQKLNGNVSDGAVFIKTMQGLEYNSTRGAFRFNKHNNAQLDKIYLIEIVSKDGKLSPKLLSVLPGGKDRPGCNLR